MATTATTTTEKKSNHPRIKPPVKIKSTKDVPGIRP